MQLISFYSGLWPFLLYPFIFVTLIAYVPLVIVKTFVEVLLKRFSAKLGPDGVDKGKHGVLAVLFLLSLYAAAQIPDSLTGLAQALAARDFIMIPKSWAEGQEEAIELKAKADAAWRQDVVMSGLSQGVLKEEDLKDPQERDMWKRIRLDQLTSEERKHFTELFKKNKEH